MALDKAIDSAQLDADLTAVADAIRAKGGTSDALTFPGGFVDAVGAIQAGGEESSSQLIALLADELEEFSDSSIVKLGSSAVRGRIKLKKVHLENCTSIGFNAFDSCKSLIELSLPNYTGTDRPSNSCIDCISLVTVNLPNVTVLPSSMFFRCKNLKQIDCPKLTTLMSSAFQESGLEEFVCPTVVTGQNSMFRSCLSLTKVDITYSSWKIENSVFYGCTSLETFILRSPTLRTLDSTNAFYNTPIASGTGYIYVPSALVEDYKVATNWATYADQIRAIEDYPEITGG